jgi:polyhydroxyalkanoate synthesis regulator phasin
MPEPRTKTEPVEEPVEEPKEEPKDDEAAETSLATRLVGVGEETVKRLYDELGKNERAREALKGARGQVERVSHSVLQQLGIAPLDELNALRGQVGRLEARVRALEGNGDVGADEPAPGESDSEAAGKKG